MIISSGSTCMSSQRQYSRTTQVTKTSFKWTLDGAMANKDSYVSNSSYSQLQHYAGSSTYSMPLSRPIPVKADNTRLNMLADESVLKTTFLELLDMLHKTVYERIYGTDTTTLVLTTNAKPTVWNRIDTTSYFMEETETTSFSTTGKVVTDDAREIEFDVSFRMSRRFTESGEFMAFSQYQQVLTDPLIINLDSNPTAITDKKFYFDLDCNGTEEEIAQLTGSSGYLALDLNGDGTINNGRELFGTASGNGFLDLSGYDKDTNGWIDENDPIFSRLKVWVKDSSGQDRLLSLKEADVGAICLKSSRTQFALMDSNNSLAGMVRASGIYLTESGIARTIQQVDF